MIDGYRFDPADPALIRDPYPYYRALVAAPGLHAAAGGYHVATRYADVRHVLSSPEFGQGDFINNIQLFYGPGFDVLSQSAYRWLSEVFVMQDPPRHIHAQTPRLDHSHSQHRRTTTTPRTGTVTQARVYRSGLSCDAALAAVCAAAAPATCAVSCLW